MSAASALQMRIVALRIYDSIIESNALPKADPPIPPLHGFELSFQADPRILLHPLQVYQTGIQMMYDFAQQAWTEVLHVAESRRFKNYDVLILFINLQLPTAPRQLEIGHGVAALYRGLNIMTDAALFCQLECQLSVMSDDVGAMSITRWHGPAIATGTASRINQTNHVARVSSNASISMLTANNGQIKDAANPSFVINYHFFGKAINSKSVSMAVLEAMTAAAPFPKDERCQELSIVSPDGVCAILIESVFSHHAFTYRWATRTLKLLYQEIVISQKRFGDVYLELRYNDQGIDQKFGELRMLKVVGGKVQNYTNAVAHER